MSKKELTLYFKRGQTLLTLNKFPESYRLIMYNWNNIVKEYKKANSQFFDETDKVTKAIKSLWVTVPKMSLSEERFDKLKKDLKLTTNSVSIYIGSTSGRLVDISKKKIDENLDNSDNSIIFE